jgi:hypothetical protein
MMNVAARNGSSVKSFVLRSILNSELKIDHSALRLCASRRAAPP